MRSDKAALNLNRGPALLHSVSSYVKRVPERVAIAVYSSQIQECAGFLKRARSIAKVESLASDNKHELIYLQLLRAAESLGYGLIACNPLNEKSVPKEASPRNRLLKIFNRMAAVNPDFFPIACESNLPDVKWLSKDSAPIRGALTRQGLLDLATKAEWHLFKQGPSGVKPIRFSKLTPDEWLTRFEKLLDSHILTMPLGTRYLVTTHLNGSVSTQGLALPEDSDNYS